MSQSTKYLDRPIPRISLHDFENRIEQITAQLVHAAETDGFFTVVNSGISPKEVNEMFGTSASFFALSDDVKSTVPFSHRNTGWEKAKQVRPSTGVADQKESYQIQYGDNMKGMWVSEEDLPGFQSKCMNFMLKAHGVSAKLMTCLARELGFPDDYFVKAHDVQDQIPRLFSASYTISKSISRHPHHRTTIERVLTQTGTYLPYSFRNPVNLDSRSARAGRSLPLSAQGIPGRKSNPLKER